MQSKGLRSLLHTTVERKVTVGGKNGMKKNKSGMGNRKWDQKLCTCLDRERLADGTLEQSSEVGEVRALGAHLKSFPHKGSSKNSWLFE